MNKYKIIANLNDGFGNTVPYNEKVEADKFDVSKTGQLRFYNFDDDGCDLIAVFPATCAVIKIEDEQEVFDKAKKEIEDRYISGTYEVPAGDSISTQNTEPDDHLNPKLHKK